MLFRSNNITIHEKDSRLQHTQYHAFVVSFTIASRRPLALSLALLASRRPLSLSLALLPPPSTLVVAHSFAYSLAHLFGTVRPTTTITIHDEDSAQNATTETNNIFTILDDH